jgi:hypothetical protein
MKKFRDKKICLDCPFNVAIERKTNSHRHTMLTKEPVPGGRQVIDLIPAA